jgi:uncharacterized membrane protein (UPF0127 family)
MVVNQTRNAMLCDRVRAADGFWRRLKGLLGTRSLHPGDGLWITPCDSVHTLGMRYPLDVLFVDESGVVVGCCDGLNPNRFSPRFRKASGVLELPAGTLARTGTQPGDQLRFGRHDPHAAPQHPEPPRLP